jgi:lycopene cyclase domain-containing protein
MNASLTYLLVDLAALLLPLLFSFHPSIQFYKQWRFFAGPCLLTAFLFVIWDIAFTGLGIWHFNPTLVLGFYIFNLPVEEILFFFCVPYACVFTYFCFSRLVGVEWSEVNRRHFVFILAAGLIWVGLEHIGQLYTSVTFFLLAALLIYHLRRNRPFLSAFFFSYFILLLPFFLVNGYLTGSFGNQAVVLYNHQMNLDLRILAIPVEDIFYGMLLILLNVTLYEKAVESETTRFSFLEQKRKTLNWKSILLFQNRKPEPPR